MPEAMPEATPKAVAPTATPKPPVNYPVTKCIALMNVLIDSGQLPSPADCDTVLEFVSDHQGVIYTQELVKGLLGGAGMPPQSGLDAVLNSLK